MIHREYSCFLVINSTVLCVCFHVVLSQTFYKHIIPVSTYRSDEEEEPKQNTEVTLGGWEVTSTNKKKKKKKKAASATATSANSEPSPDSNLSKTTDPPAKNKVTVKRKAEPHKSDSNNREVSKKQKTNEGKSKHQVKKTQNQNPFSKEVTTNGVSDDRLKAYGINPKKFHNQQKYGKNGQVNQQKNQNKSNQSKKPNHQAKKKQPAGDKKSKWD